MKTKKWQLQDAKNKFSEVVRKANEEGPQFVTKHGKESAVVISFREYKKMHRPRNNLVEFFKNSPLSESDIDLTRDKSLPRNISL